MILSHFSYCITSWSQASKTTLMPLQSLYKQAIKIFDKKPKQYHHCPILSAHNMLNFENFILYSYVRLVFKINQNAAPPPLKRFVQLRSEQTSKVTRSVSRGHCGKPKCDSTFAQSAFSYKAIDMWNKLPTQLTKSTDFRTFSKDAKKWFITNQSCQH